MKTDVLYAIAAGIAGVVVAYIITANVILPKPKPVAVKTLSSTASANIDEPNPEIFNYRALNPTVEVYIDCSNYDIDGSCLDGAEN
ncbi:hypothetical protein IJ076_00180 [Candidatus Saccharibacteria bacterium]|nr:hypothetical protein [Candidatus Saccharibacteria bacterium]